METTDRIRELEIARGFQHGESWAFEAAARAYFKPMVHFVCHLTHHQEERAVDLVQEAFYLACRAHKNVDPHRSLAPWLFQIVRNLAYKEHDRLKKRREISLDNPTPDSEPHEPASHHPDPRKHYEEVELQERMNRVIDRIKPKYRDVLILRVIEGLRSEHVSKLLNIPVATVNTRTHRALQQFRKKAASEGIHEKELLS